MFGQEGEGGVGFEPGCDGGGGGGGGCVHGHVGESRVESESMYLNICVCSCTRVPVCEPVYLYVCVYM